MEATEWIETRQQAYEAISIFQPKQVMPKALRLKLHSLPDFAVIQIARQYVRARRAR